MGRHSIKLQKKLVVMLLKKIEASLKRFVVCLNIEHYNKRCFKYFLYDVCSVIRGQFIDFVARFFRFDRISGVKARALFL